MNSARLPLAVVPAVVPAVLASICLAFLSGCASTTERSSFDQYYREEAASYPREGGWERPDTSSTNAYEGEPPGTGEALAPQAEQPTGVPEIGPDSNLSDLLLYAALQNPGLEAAFHEWKAALERIPQSRSLPDPRFTYVYYIQTVETRLGPQEQSFALAQTFPWLGKLQRQGDMAAYAAEAARERYEAQKLKLFYQVTSAYLEYYYLYRSLEVARGNVMLMSNLEAVVRSSYRTGLAPYAAVVKAQVELGRLEEHLETMEDLRAPTEARVNAALGRAHGAYLPYPILPEQAGAALADSTALRLLKTNNPELKALGFMARREEATVSFTKHAYVPDITLGAALVETGDAISAGIEDSGKDAVMASLSLSIPIWLGKYRAAGREAEAKHRAAAGRLEDLEKRLVTDLQVALFNLRSAERRIDLYGDSLLPKAEASLSAAQTAFAAGRGDFFDVIEAQRTLLEFQLSYERALADRAQRLAEINMLTGGPVEGEPAGAE